MPSAEHRTTIARPVGEVFAFVARGENARRWRPSVVSVRLRSGSDGQPGATYEQRVKGPFGGSVPADYEITEIVPNAALRFRAVAGPVRPEGSYRFEEQDGSTVVTFRLECDPHGFASLMSPMIAQAMRGEVASLENLKRVLEGGS